LEGEHAEAMRTSWKAAMVAPRPIRRLEAGRDVDELKGAEVVRRMAFCRSSAPRWDHDLGGGLRIGFCP